MSDRRKVWIQISTFECFKINKITLLVERRPWPMITYILFHIYNVYVGRRFIRLKRQSFKIFAYFLYNTFTLVNTNCIVAAHINDRVGTYWKCIYEFRQNALKLQAYRTNPTTSLKNILIQYLGRHQNTTYTNEHLPSRQSP